MPGVGKVEQAKQGSQATTTAAAFSLSPEIEGTITWEENTMVFTPANGHNYTYKETRGERVSFFITEMNAGKHLFTYFVRATQDGRFVAMPAEAYTMYDLATWGRSSSVEVVIGE